jgi:hypothetical protein
MLNSAPGALVKHAPKINKKVNFLNKKVKLMLER